MLLINESTVLGLALFDQSQVDVFEVLYSIRFARELPSQKMLDLGQPALGGLKLVQKLGVDVLLFLAFTSDLGSKPLVLQSAYLEVPLHLLKKLLQLVKLAFDDSLFFKVLTLDYFKVFLCAFLQAVSVP